ncbi:MAG TPA: DMT family transporter [Jatrophihabitantaceae bacterium]|nr:DMT family transporter [Jatrophihabitantaceae bacterium]
MNRAVPLAVTAAVLSGVAVFVNSYGVKAVHDATVYTTGKNLVAGVTLLLIALGSTRDRAAQITLPRKRGQLIGLGVLAVVGGSVPFVLFFEGLSRIQSGPVQAQFINKTLVVWVSVLAVVFLRERVGVAQVAAIGLLVAGQAVLAGGGSGLSKVSWGTGELMILAATLFWAVEVVLAKVLLRSLSSWTVALARMLAGSALLVVWTAIRGKMSALAHLDASQWKWIIVTGVLLAAYVATWLAALALAPAVTVTAVLVGAVPVTALLQAIVNGTPLGPQLSGLALLIAGAAIALAAAPRVRGRLPTEQQVPVA